MARSNLLLLSLFAASLLTGGCASSGPSYEAPVDSGYRVTINRDFEAVPNDSHLYFQHGRLVDGTALDRWSAYCQLHLLDRNEDAKQSLSLAAGSFDIADVKLRYRSSEFPYYGIQAGDTLIGFGLIEHRDSPEYGWRRDNPPSHHQYRVEMSLGSAIQPNVRSLICSRKSNTRGSYYPTLDEIQQILGEIIEIEAAI